MKKPSAKWIKLLRLIPGYDPFASAGECWFDEAAAQKAIGFFPDCLRHVEGEMRGKPFELQPWQQSIVGNLFGWKMLDWKGREVRRYRECLIYVPRKNGKTPLSAGIALYVFFCDDEAGQQDYIAAGEREQAGMLFRQARGMIEQEPELSQRCHIYGGTAAAGQSKSIVRESDQSFLRVISADAETKHGGTTHLAIIDELHVQPNRELYDVLRSSVVSENRKQPLLLWITTADFARTSVCNEVHAHACKVRDNNGDSKKSGNDPRFLPVIYEAPTDADWRKEKVWEAANPNLGISVSRDALRRECAKAIEQPAEENKFKRLHLNMKTEQDVRAIPMDKWDLCGGTANPEAWRIDMLARLRGQACTGGLDLGSVGDLTALVLLFGDDEDGYDVLPWFWAPRENAEKREKKDRVEYLSWGNRGFITLTDGDETDYAVVRSDVNSIASEYGLYDLAVDRLYQGAQLCQDLGRDGLTINVCPQTFLEMAAPTRRFLELIAAGKIRHGNNPVLRWMAANASAECDTRNPAEVLKFSKRKSNEKIDGIVAAVMAIRTRMLSPGNTSVYERESRGFVTLG